MKNANIAKSLICAAIFAATCAVSIICLNCGIYSMSGSTLPLHIKTVELPVFGNSTLEPGIDDEVTAELAREIMKSQLRPANRDADATIGGTVTRYSHRPHTFGAGGADVSVELYIVQISADVKFYDNKKDQIIYEGTVSGEGTYDFGSEEERIGREKAVKNLVEKIIQNSVQMW
jgi:hypothetical protein